MTEERIVAVGLLTQQDLARLGQDFKRYFPVPIDPCFTELLEAIDVADGARVKNANGQPLG